MIDPDLVTAMRAGFGRRHVFVIFHLDAGEICLSDSSRPIEYEARLYQPAGGFGQIRFQESETSTLSGAMELSFSAAFAGVQGAAVHDALQAAIGATLRETPLQGRKMTLFRAVTDLEGRQVLHDPERRVRGVIDVVTGQSDGEDGPSLTLKIEDRGFLGTVVAPRRSALADHQRLNPGSSYFEQSAQMGLKDINWGKSS